MSICKACADVADGKTRGGLTCSWCGHPGVAVYRTDVPLDEQKVVHHKDRREPFELYSRVMGDGSTRVGWRRPKCPGSGYPPDVVDGHDDCDGCPCQHRPSGSWNQHKESP